jgi:hypothetical protein
VYWRRTVHGKHAESRRRGYAQIGRTRNGIFL